MKSFVRQKICDALHAMRAAGEAWITHEGKRYRIQPPDPGDLWVQGILLVVRAKNGYAIGRAGGDGRRFWVMDPCAKLWINRDDVRAVVVEGRARP